MEAITPWYGEATARVTAQCYFRNNWQRQDSNPGPHGPKPNTLPTELSRPAYEQEVRLCVLQRYQCSYQ